MPHVYVAGITHPGVEHRENQDAFFVWRDLARGHVVAGILDGHGRELGQTAAYAARDCFERSVPGLAADDFRAFSANPVGELQRLFDAAHLAVRDAFVRDLEVRAVLVAFGAAVLPCCRAACVAL